MKKEFKAFQKLQNSKRMSFSKLELRVLSNGSGTIEDLSYKKTLTTFKNKKELKKFLRDCNKLELGKN